MERNEKNYNTNLILIIYLDLLLNFLNQFQIIELK